MSEVVVVSNRPGFDAELATEMGNGSLRVSQVEIGNSVPERLIIDAVPADDDVVVLVGPDLERAQSLLVLAALDQHRPRAATVLVAAPSPETLQQALRLGARGLVPPSADVTLIADEVTTALESVQRLRQSMAPSGRHDPARRVLSVLSAKGGTGKTTVASNIAIALAAAAPGQVALVDFDLQFGDVEYALRLKPELTIADLARAASRVDETSVKAFLTSHPSGVFALCGAARPSEAEELNPELLTKVIDLLRAQFRFVVIDTAGGIDDASLVAMDVASDLVLMSSTDIPSVRAMQKTTEALTALGFDDRAWHYVLNRSDAKVGLTADDIADAVGLPIDLAVPETKSMTLAMNQGAPVVETDPRSSAAKRIAGFVERFLPDEVEEGRSRRLSLRGAK